MIQIPTSTEARVWSNYAAPYPLAAIVGAIYMAISHHQKVCAITFLKTEFPQEQRDKYQSKLEEYGYYIQWENTTTNSIQMKVYWDGRKRI